MPEPSSRRVEEGVKTECVVKGLVGEESQDPTSGVIFQRTTEGLVGFYGGGRKHGGEEGKTYLRL